MFQDKIDVHAHFIPEEYREALIAAGKDRPDGIPALPQWSEELALASMHELGIRLAILSISSPGVHFGDGAAAVELARSVNKAGARIVRSTPNRFGLFAALPLPEVDAATAETRYALDKLGADGVCLLTNHHGMYLGDERLEPIYAEVAARNSVVFVHPTSPPEIRGGPGFAAPMLEFIFETTRSITDLVLSGVLRRHPDLRVIVPHAGAALPVVAGRVDMLAWVLANLPNGTEIPSMRTALKALHFDLAGAPVEEQLGALLAVADASKLHYGSDFPFTPTQACGVLMQQLQTSRNLDDSDLEAVLRDNSYDLLSIAGAPSRNES
jgi:predicted TIM-barrel fold metal-dependent hydrolase